MTDVNLRRCLMNNAGRRYYGRARYGIRRQRHTLDHFCWDFINATLGCINRSAHGIVHRIGEIAGFGGRITTVEFRIHGLHGGGGRAVSRKGGWSKFDVCALSERDAGTSSEARESRTLSTACTAEEEDVDSGSCQSSEDDEQNGDNDVSWSDAFRGRRSAQQMGFAVYTFVIVGTLALDLAVTDADAAVLARATQRRRARPFLRSVARYFASSLNLDCAVGTSATISARNEDAQVSARAVKARVVDRRVVSIFTEHFDGTGRGDVFNEPDHNATSKFILSSEFSFTGGNPVEGALENVQRRWAINVIASQNRSSARAVSLHHLDRAECVVGPEYSVVHGEVDGDGCRMSQSFRHQNFTFRTIHPDCFDTRIRSGLGPVKFA